MSPFIEEDGTFRVKGRLKHSNLDYNAKHPILLTAKHPVVQLLLERAHRDNVHEGTEYVSKQQRQRTSAVQDRNRSQSPNNNFRNRSAERGNRSTMKNTTPQVIYQPVPSSGASGLPKLKLTEFSGDPLEWPEWSGLFDVVVHQKPISDTEKMQYLKTSLTGQAKATISGMGFSSQSYYHAWDILCEKYGRSDFIVNAQFKKILTHPPVRHDDSTSIVKFANVVTNVVNTLTQLGYTSDQKPEAETGLSSTTRKLYPQLREQWLQYMQDR